MVGIPTLPFLKNNQIYGNPILGNLFFNVPGEVGPPKLMQNVPVTKRVKTNTTEDAILSKLAAEYSKEWTEYNVVTRNCKDFAKGLFGYLEAYEGK